MAHAPRRRKADDPALRAEVEELRRAGLPINRADIAARHGVSSSVVQTVRSEIDQVIAAEPAYERQPDPEPEPATARPGGRTVTEFDGTCLRALRRDRRLMQDELALMAGVSRGEIGHLERGHRKPTLRTLRNLEKALEVPAGTMLANGKLTHG
jgi:DNA-binding XRE family transcriptional regulator